MLVLVVAACERDSSGSRASTNVSAAAPSCPAPPADLLGFERDLVTRVNELRARGGQCTDAARFAAAGQLASSAPLACAARLNSHDMAQTGHFAHRNLDQLGPRERSRRAGYAGKAVRENLAWGQRTSEAVVAAWLGSREHCRALFAPDANEIGVGVALGPGNKQFWTLLLGTR